MAYCLRSFVQILEEVLHPEKHYKTWVLDHDKIPQVQSLLENATFLRDLFDNSSPILQYSIESLEDQIMKAAGKAEDTLETYLTGELISNPEGQSFAISPPNLGEAIQAFEDAKKEVNKILDAKPAQQPDGNVLLPVSTTRYPNHNNMVVGVTEDLNHLRSRLTSRESELDIIPIVGMGGMGKTTLARILYDEYASRNSHFDCFAWVTVSQTYDPKLILRTVLASVTRKPLDEISYKQTTSELIVTLYQTLFGRRYLIVVDDIWSSKAWDDVRMAFPQENKKSRIILTTRENIVADYVNPKCHKMHLLNEDDSWELLRGIVFRNEYCPCELENVGKKITICCGGLPLAVQVIGGLLSQSHKSLDFWEHVAHNVRSLIAETNEQFSGIFDWSFAHLPHYLKPCFLYMACFPEDEEILASKVRKLWIAEGFLLPIRGKSLEEAARIHLNALIARNLIFIHSTGKKGRAKSVLIHDLLRDLCLRKAQEKKFICPQVLQTDNLQEDVLCIDRIVIVTEWENLPVLTPLTRSFQFTRSSEWYRKPRHEYDRTIMSYLCFKLPLLRVLDIGFGICFREFPEVILQLVNLRYLDILTLCNIPVSISVLRNLQTLLVNQLSSLAIISQMPQLRHLNYYGRVLYCSELEYGVHENLQSLSYITSKGVGNLFAILPKLRKLKIRGEEEFINLSGFHNLETLKCRCSSSLHNMTFPVSLQQLSLMNFKMGQSLLDVVGKLPHLQILKLHCSNYYSKNSMPMDWEPCEGGYCALQYLEIQDCKLVNWIATDINFPVLEHLILLRCDSLIEIPIDIGDIETLKIIEVDFCLPSVFESARKIYEDQCQFGNTLTLRLGQSL